MARYKASGRAQEMREVSRFVREKGRWLYFDGDIAETE
ncbi:MAG: YchJ family metal-binding protein [Rhodomicrobium sp.]